jgi:hypothetical protein
MQNAAYSSGSNLKEIFLRNVLAPLMPLFADESVISK